MGLPFSLGVCDSVFVSLLRYYAVDLTESVSVHDGQTHQIIGL